MKLKKTVDTIEKKSSSATIVSLKDYLLSSTNPFENFIEVSFTLNLPLLISVTLIIREITKRLSDVLEVDMFKREENQKLRTSLALNWEDTISKRSEKE